MDSGFGDIFCRLNDSEKSYVMNSKKTICVEKKGRVKCFVCVIAFVDKILTYYYSAFLQNSNEDHLILLDNLFCAKERSIKQAFNSLLGAWFA